jgi:hypothetical protein
MPFVEAKRLSKPEIEARDRATQFVACAFRGAGSYERVSAPTFAGALVAAPLLYAGDGRGVMIYAVDDGGHQAALGFWEPEKVSRNG